MLRRRADDLFRGWGTGHKCAGKVITDDFPHTLTAVNETSGSESAAPLRSTPRVVERAAESERGWNEW